MRLAHRKQSRVTQYLWDGQSIVLEVNAGTDVAKKAYLRGAGLLAQQIDGSLSYYLHNAHGDVVQRTDASGRTLRRYTYNAFGCERAEGVRDTDPNPFRYCGEYWDSDLQELYLRARTYNPQNGRFSQEDSARDGANWYSYANANPNMYSDPSGEDAIVINKPVENPLIALLGEEHMSILLEDNAGRWHYVSYIGSSVVYEEIKDTSALTSMDEINQYLKEQKIVKPVEKDFTKGAYITGDFSSAAQEAEAWAENPSLIRYRPNLLEALVDLPINFFAGMVGTNYSLLFNNCAHAAMYLMEQGVDTQGRTIGSYYLQDAWRQGLGNMVSSSPRANYNIVANVVANVTVPKSQTSYVEQSSGKVSIPRNVRNTSLDPYAKIVSKNPGLKIAGYNSPGGSLALY